MNKRKTITKPVPTARSDDPLAQREPADAEIVSSDDLDVDEALNRCRWGVPVNVRLDVAIAAHTKAAMQDDRQITAYALRMVIVAMAPEAADVQKKSDYLADLPLQAWDVLDSDKDIRNQMIATLVATAAWMQAA
ncbi:MAG TPA: hypothetical protein PLX43_00440 [Nitrobacter sp.]|uniref:hypothetical protein n=1 Tax=Nitrobacter sp. TaxID=29420 RepID=UPI002CA79AC6|nr:hypothetical protein [Nitrobacter sp.]